MSDQRRATGPCPSRYLTGDGAVLRCALPHGPASADPPKIHTDAFMDTPGRGLNWRPDDPCEWDADAHGEGVPARLTAVTDAELEAAELATRGHGLLKPPNKAIPVEVLRIALEAAATTTVQPLETSDE